MLRAFWLLLPVPLAALLWAGAEPSGLRGWLGPVGGAVALSLLSLLASAAADAAWRLRFLARLQAK